MNSNKAVTLGLWIGTVNHLVTIAAVFFGCMVSGFTCQGEEMKDALSIYAFTLLTPQIACEAILLLGLFLATANISQLTQNKPAFVSFAVSLLMVVFAALWLG